MSTTTLDLSDFADDPGTPLDELFGDGGDAAGVPQAADASPMPDAVVLSPRLFKVTAGMRRRGRSPITGYVGLNGNGKSLAAVRDISPALLDGQPVLSTVALLDPHTGNEHPGYTRLHSWQQLLEFRGGTIFLDEAAGIADSRDSGMPKHVRRHIQQFRRSQTLVRWTGIDFDNIDKRLRQITQAVVRCRGYRIDPRRTDDLWARNQLFVFTTFDAQTLQHADDTAQLTEDRNRRRRARVLNRELIWGPGSLAFRCYNTLDAVAWVDNSCVICGGKPVEKTCRGH